MSCPVLRRRAEPAARNGVRSVYPASRPTFDATPLLQRWGDLDLGMLRLSEVQLCERGRPDPKTGGYRCLARLPLP
jgi:AKAP7 2'5' RNA ligase-like domain